MSFINKLWIKLFYKKVGTDQFGNIYYLSSEKNYLGSNKRYVYYLGLDESSKVPPNWHAWLHYLSDSLPEKVDNYEWQKEHVPNLTGTKDRFNPQISSKKLKTYEAWTPSNK